MSTATKKTGKAGRSAIADVVAREYTIHMHKRVRLPPPPPDERKRERTIQMCQKRIEPGFFEETGVLTDMRGTAARCYLQEESPQGHQGDQGLRIQGYGTQ